MESVVIVIHLLVVSALVVVVLLQRSEGGALGIGGGGGFMTGRGQANVLTRATAILATIFFLTSITLTIMANVGRSNKSIFEGAPAQPAQTAPGQTPAAPGGGLFDQLKRMEQPAQSGGATAPAAPSSPLPPPVAPPAGGTPPQPPQQ